MELKINMSTIDAFLKPFKFVENEVESVVAKVYNIYHDKTGDDQYGLSNQYVNGAFIFYAAKKIVNEGISVENGVEIAFGGLLAASCHYMNNKHRKVDQKNRTSSTPIKNYEREIDRMVDKSIGRIALLMTADCILEQTTGYSTRDFHGLEPDQTNLTNMLEITQLSLVAFYAYTASIDTHNLAKSKLASKVKQMLHTPELTTAGVEN